MFDRNNDGFVNASDLRAVLNESFHINASPDLIGKIMSVARSPDGLTPGDAEHILKCIDASLNK
jgi:Ca2+-binding EF-hand superfamily protein